MTLNSCVYTIIVLVSILTFVWPLYIYFMFKWHKNHHHFVIRNRWPIISLTIVTFAIITQLLSITEAILCITSLSPISIGITNAMSGLVYYRAHLLFLQTLKAREHLNAMVPSKARHMLIHNEKKTLTIPNIWSKTILALTFVTTILVIILRFLDISIMYAMAVTQLIGIISIINLIRAKVLDSIGICKECICQISSYIIMICFGASSKSWAPTYIEVNLYAGFVTVTLYGFFVVFIPLHLIRKVKSENNITKKSTNTSTDKVRLSRVISESIGGERQQGLSVVHMDHQVSISQIPPLTDTISLHKSLKKTLSEFLNENLLNYSLFAGYLSECFALENMLFLERSIILYHIIRKYRGMEINNAVLDESNEKLFSAKCYELKFNFLSQIYLDIEEIIEKNGEVNANDNLLYRRGIVKAMKMIYEQFCCTDSITEINVSYDIIYNLQTLFENKSDDEILNQLKSYNDMLTVFHFAIKECWNMCVAIYGFQFKSYLKKHSPTNTKNIKSKPNISVSLIENDANNQPSNKDEIVMVGFGQ